MKRILVIAIALIGSAVILVTGIGSGGDDGTYEVRAIFGNAAFLVPGEQVRVAGAPVGTVSDVDVTNNTEPALRDGGPDPGKAVVVLQVDDAGFQDFRTDASCLIRPQSLIGEKFVECTPTQPRAPDTAPPPELTQVADGEPGAGQYLLPLENNGTAVDLDLVNNIMKEPYPERFRLILNSLGAGLAARGKDLAEIVERANPALRETNRVLAVLAGQSQALSKLSADSDTVLTALARKRENIASFINQSTTVAEATAERSADLEQSFARLPAFLRELRSTMNRLNAFSTTATPVFSDLGQAAPALTRATKALGPFSEAGIPALTSLGDAAAKAGPDIVASDPVIKQIRGLAKSGKPATKNLAKLLANLRKTSGYQYLNNFIFNSGGSVNAFDGYGHFLRALLPNNNCVDYETIAEPACAGNFRTQLPATKTAAALEQLIKQTAAKELRGSDHSGHRHKPDRADPAHGSRDHGVDTDPQPSNGGNGGDGGQTDGGSGVGQTPTPTPDPTPTTPDQTTPDQPGVEVDPAPAQPGAAPTTQKSRADMRAARDLLDFLVGDQPRKHRGKR